MGAGRGGHGVGCWVQRRYGGFCMAGWQAGWAGLASRVKSPARRTSTQHLTVILLPGSFRNHITFLPSPYAVCTVYAGMFTARLENDVTPRRTSFPLALHSRLIDGSSNNNQQ